jgi:hypothetical protein
MKPILATELEMRGTDGVWRVMNIQHALRNRGRMKMRCVLCKGQVSPHDVSLDGSNPAHVEHRISWEGCPRCEAYDNNGLRPHRVRVPD